MESQFEAAVLECTAGSDAGRLSFPEVIGRLVAAGVERYHTDLVRAEKTYYLPDGETRTLPCHPVASSPAEAFDAAGVEAAVRTIQAGGVDYAGFCERIALAGCVGYLVSLLGRRAVYYGRTGETFVEPFPPQ